jgi:hypothetical protein
MTYLWAYQLVMPMQALVTGHQNCGSGQPCGYHESTADPLCRQPSEVFSTNSALAMPSPTEEQPQATIVTECPSFYFSQVVFQVIVFAICGTGHS